MMKWRTLAVMLRLQCLDRARCYFYTKGPNWWVWEESHLRCSALRHLFYRQARHNWQSAHTREMGLRDVELNHDGEAYETSQVAEPSRD